MSRSRMQAIAAIALATLVAGSVTVEAATFSLVSPHVIIVTGTVELGDCNRWKAAIKPTVDTVILHSPGGRNGQGQCISRSIAERHLKTFVQGRCASICFLLFAAGAEKWACDGAKIGVHRPADAVTREESADPTFLRTILEYAARYHVPRAIQDKLSETPPKAIYWLVDSDLASMNVKRC
jgi:hypothetical protein